MERDRMERRPRNADDARRRPRDSDRQRYEEPHRRRARRDESPPSRHRDHRDHRDQRAEERPWRRHSQSPPPPPQQQHHHHHQPEDTKAEEEVEVGRPDFTVSGLLARAENTLEDGIVLKYHEPPEARVPSQPWRLYVFKGDEQVAMFPLLRQSAYLFGRERKIADIPIDHPSCSKQHAVLQFRLTDQRGGSSGSGGSGISSSGISLVKPYILDLDSTNGVHLNGIRLGSRRYYELRPKDMLQFGMSTREYVLLKEVELPRGAPQ